MPKRKSKSHNLAISSPLHLGLILCLLSLITVGLVVLYSGSYPLAKERFGDGFFYLRRQLFFLIIGVGFLFAAIKIPYRYWGKMALPCLGFSAILLFLVYIPGLGISAGGARRWISLGGGFRFQPSEFAKFALILYLASSLFRKREKLTSFQRGVLPHIIVPSFILGLTLLQPDFGSFLTMGFFVFLMLFIAGARLQHLIGIGLACLPMFYFLIIRVPYRRKRFFSFLNPWADAQDSGFQIIQSQLAFHRGGVSGVGLGEGQQKLFYLPDIHTDFIFSVIGEEMGFVGVAFVVLLFLTLSLLGFAIALKANRQNAPFACFLATGLTVLITVPAFINMAVVLGLLPTKGMVLPFLSYGGSALVVALLSCGILIHLSHLPWRNQATSGGYR